MDYSRKKIVVADLDGTLTISKTPIDGEMAMTVAKLLQNRSFAVISGGSYAQFQKQFLPNMTENPRLLSRLYLFPTCATAFYRFNNTGWAGENGWERVYSEELTVTEKKKILTAFDAALKETKFDFSQSAYGERLEDRITQITFSALGQQMPFDVKSKWDPDHKKREAIVAALVKRIPEFDISIGGTTSIDVTRKGIDKEYGINKIREKLGFRIDDMLFIGDSLFEGGNDYPAARTGVDCVQVSDPEETKRVLREIIATGRG